MFLFLNKSHQMLGNLSPDVRTGAGSMDPLSLSIVKIANKINK